MMVTGPSTFKRCCFVYDPAVSIGQLLYFGLLLLVVVLLTGCSSNAPRFTFVATATGLGDDSQDVYIGFYESGATVAIQSVTQTPEWEQSPTISSDEDWILYKIGGSRLENRLYLHNWPTGTTKELERGGYVIPGPFSPDGSRLTYMSDRVDGVHRLFVVDIERMEPQMVPVGVGKREIVSVSWRPDGQRMAIEVMSSRHDLDPAPPSIYIYDFEDGSLDRLTDKEDGACESPAWSPNGDWIAAVCSRDGDSGQLYLISPDGDPFRLLKQPEHLRGVLQPQWSPSGDFILLRIVTEPNEPGEYYLTNLDGNFQRFDPGNLPDIRSVFVKP